ncbi:family 43 glycosylhydrolase [Isoptericola sp. F-RaC21]|uniref:family 43 glycosylhydrolase n=1 Tax=Isoptericola sp. F-RaC21 TaxID=3141452 RepID=UPI00315C1DDE
MTRPPLRATTSPSTTRAAVGVLALLVLALCLAAAPAPTARAAVALDRWFVITSAHSGLALQVEGETVEPHADLVQEARTGARSQQFRFLESADGSYRIQSRLSGQVLDVLDFSEEDGAAVIQWPDHDGANQRWVPVERSDGTTSFRNVHSGKMLDLLDGSVAPGAPVGQFGDNGLDAQRWELDPVADAGLANPLRSNGADPWIQYSDGAYYMSTTTWDSTVTMRRSTTLAGLATAPDTVVWDDAGTDSRCCSHWAPEFHEIDGTWYLMYTSGSSQTDLDGQKLRVLRSTGDTPMGPYEFMGTPLPDQWNIDGTYLEVDGELYLLWSEWVGEDQSVRVARMTNPWTVTGPQSTVARPEHAWETQGGRVNEAPAVLQRDGRTFVTFSASSCNTPDYALGLLELTGADPLDPGAWTKSPDPLLQRGNGVFGPGHNGFFTSPDGTEDWIVYHGNTSATQGCGDTRQTRVQKVGWNDDGTPSLGAPVPSGEALAPPSGE